jgi:hypothetical protein
MTLAWTGWKQSESDIAVELGSGHGPADSKRAGSKNVMQTVYYSTSLVLNSRVLLIGGAAGLSCTELSIWEFPFLKGVCWQGHNRYNITPHCVVGGGWCRWCGI